MKIRRKLTHLGSLPIFCPLTIESCSPVSSLSRGPNEGLFSGEGGGGCVMKLKRVISRGGGFSFSRIMSFAV